MGSGLLPPHPPGLRVSAGVSVPRGGCMSALPAVTGPPGLALSGSSMSQALQAGWWAESVSCHLSWGALGCSLFVTRGLGDREVAFGVRELSCVKIWGDT